MYSALPLAWQGNVVCPVPHSVFMYFIQPKSDYNTLETISAINIAKMFDGSLFLSIIQRTIAIALSLQQLCLLKIKQQNQFSIYFLFPFYHASRKKRSAKV